jgi:hypothetical protein
VALVPGPAVDAAPDGVCWPDAAGRPLERRVFAAVRRGGGGHPGVDALLRELR